MLFNSAFFISVFLPSALAGWYFLNRFNRRSCAKAFWWECRSGFTVIIIRCISGFCWQACPSITGSAPSLREWVSRRADVCSWGQGLPGIWECCFILNTLISLSIIAISFSWQSFRGKDRPAPGDQFFTFQQISYIVERYRGNIGHAGLLDYGCFISFFPQLVAGPIVLYQEFVPQLQSKEAGKLSWDSLYDGISLFIMGLAKKVLLADALAVVVNAEFEVLLYLDTLSAWAVLLFLCWNCTLISADIRIWRGNRQNVRLRTA